ncbi:OLC1v1001846C1 [Oldenlandia corymbosa var. corymbosa]|uniref:OLC1v1001846C1 n=1 Tax=Oldenlandia corymbosa var. corymbosa TaxID=529605 RepID=A0AAV1D8J5_OLDCO|nr:OLC1v1001846C1 [Oldenlandia corymbosa var. corymbosa]
MGHQGQRHSTIHKIDVVETSETKLSSIDNGLKDMDASLNGHGHIRHSGPSHQVSSSSPLEHEEQCFLNSAGVEFAATSEMKLSSIEGSSGNVFKKSECSDDSCVRQSGFISNIASDSPNPSHQEQGQLIMLDSDDTKDTSPTTNEMSKGTISNGWPYGAAAASAFISSQFSLQNKSILMTLSVDQAKASTTTSLVTGEVSAELISNNSDQARQLDLLADSVSLEQLDQNHLKTHQDKQVNMGKIKLPEEKSVPKKGFHGNKSQVRHTDSGGNRVKQMVVPSQAKGCSNHAWIYDKRGSVRLNNKRHKVAKKDVDMKPKVNEDKECNEDNRLKNDEAELKVVKPMEEQQIQSQLKDDNNQLALSGINLASTINKEKICKQTSNTVSGSAISFPVFIQFDSQSEGRCEQPINFSLIVQGRDSLAVTDKEGAKEIGSNIVSSVTATNPVLKKFNNQFEVRRERVTTSSLNQGRHFSTVTKEVKNKGVVPGVKVQDDEKQKVNSAFSSPTLDARFSPKSGLSVNMAQE